MSSADAIKTLKAFFLKALLFLVKNVFPASKGDGAGSNDPRAVGKKNEW